MDFKRSILYFILAILGVMIWHTWQNDYPVNKQTDISTLSSSVSTTTHPVDFAPIANNESTNLSNNAISNVDASKTLSTVIPPDKMITIKTDVIDAKINLRGGNLVSTKLLHYPVSVEEKNIPVHILNSQNTTLYIAQSGFSGKDQKTSAPIDYTSSQNQYILQPGQNILVVTLSGKTADGLSVQKIFTFKRNNYVIGTQIQLKNNSANAWQGNIYNQIMRRYVPIDGAYKSRSYYGAAVSTANTPYKKLSFDHLSENNFSRDIQNGWIAMQQQYFLSAWIPPKNQMLHYYSRSFGHGDDGQNNLFVLGYLSPSIQLATGSSTTFSSTLYVGPEEAKNLESLAKGLDLTVDYGFLSPISKFLFWLMKEIHHFVGNWGWSIVLVTILIKIAFYWFSKKSYVSMAKTRDLQPKIKALKDRYENDKAAMSKAMMELYRKEKINPLGGCLPMIIQIPVFFALYYVLVESVELRQAPFIFWIHDLSVRDPYFILPVLMGLSMLLQQKLSPPPPDPMQAKMMMLLPVVLTVFFATFPAGLVLYWLTNNLASILQQWYVMRTTKNTVKYGNSKQRKK